MGNARLIYAVDDLPALTDLYTIFLESAGYSVRAFSDRTEALAALEAGERKPDLLITDFLGLSLPVERFIVHCLALHPGLRILLATGFDRTDRRCGRVRPDRFLRKPFTYEEFQREVRASLAD
jgi:DNA-binding NtrC family response regulator